MNIEANDLVETTPADSAATPVSESPSVVTEVTESATPQKGQVETSPSGKERDPLTGRFVARPGEVAIGDPTVEATPEAAVEQPKEEPWFYTARDNQYTIEGATRIPGKGVLIPDSGVTRLEQLARTAHEAGVFRSQLQAQARENAELKEQATARSKFNEIVGKEYFALVDLVKTDPEAALTKLFELADNLPVLRERARAEEAIARAEKIEKGRQPTQEEIIQREHDEQIQVFNEVYHELKNDPNYSLLTPNDWKAFVKYAESIWGNLRVRLEGGDKFRDDLLIEWAKDRAEVRKEFKAAEAANKHNKEQLAPAVKPVNSPVPAKGTGTQAPNKSTKPRFSRENVEDDIEAFLGR